MLKKKKKDPVENTEEINTTANENEQDIDQQADEEDQADEGVEAVIEPFHRDYSLALATAPAMPSDPGVSTISAP